MAGLGPAQLSCKTQATVGNMRDDSAEILFQYFLQEALVNSYGMGRNVHSLMLSIHVSSASLTLQGVLKDGFGEVVVARDMLEPCEFPSVDSSQRKLLWAHKLPVSVL